MLLHPAIITHNIADDSSHQDVIAAYHLDCRNPDVLSSRYQEIYNGNITSPFCVSMDVHDITIKSDVFSTITDHLLSLSFHYRYYTFNLNKPLVLIQASDADAFLESLPGLQKAFAGQGFAGMDYVLMDEKNTGKAHCSDKRLTLFEYDEAACFEPRWLSLLQHTLYADGVVVIRNKEGLGMPDIIQKVEAAEGAFNLQHKQAFELLQLQQKYYRDLIALQNKIKILEDRNQSLESYHSSNSNIPESELEKQFKRFINFYNKEYEILPMWYKQFGHLIKVLSGKRTLRSLFNDNVKKYKD